MSVASSYCLRAPGRAASIDQRSINNEEADAFRTEFKDVHWPRKGNFMRLLVHFKKKKKQSKTKESLG